MLIDVQNPASIKNFLKSCSKQSGIYQMYNNTDEVLYVGKAKNLSNRLASYFNKSNQSPKVAALVQQIVRIETTITNTEAEALILECNLIKKYRPKYNVLLRDDKSYPYICLSKHKYPRIYIHRGRKPKDAHCFGPYPNVYAAKSTVRLLQQVFLIRTCTDSYYNNRTRPCLLYQINRCTAPCVDYIKQEDYQYSIKDTRLFLEGKSDELIKTMASKMDSCSAMQDYEQAALYRDRIIKLKEISEQQYVDADNKSSKANQKPIDVIAIYIAGIYLVTAILKFRDGRLLGSNEFITKVPLWYKNQDSVANSDVQKTSKQHNTDDVLLSILSQYYMEYSDGKPEQIILNYKLSEKAKNLLIDLFKQAHCNQENCDQLEVLINPRGTKSKWLNLALKNATEILAKKQKHNEIYARQFEDLKTVLKLKHTPNTIECFDVSHTFGNHTIASCVVFTKSGPDKSCYRRYNIANITKGDDVAALKQVLTRRFKKLCDTNELDKIPDIVLIDGGKQQVNAAKQVFVELGLEKQSIYGITKGEGRKAINDRILSSVALLDIRMPSKSEGLHLLQHIRDEAHRFAIMGHRAKRGKEQLHSLLDDIPGVGASRKKNLLTYLGGMQKIKQANVEQLAKVPGISKQLAEIIYNYLNG